jgi:hypothetical protein
VSTYALRGHDPSRRVSEIQDGLPRRSPRCCCEVKSKRLAARHRQQPSRTARLVRHGARRCPVSRGGQKDRVCYVGNHVRVGTITTEAVEVLHSRVPRRTSQQLSRPEWSTANRPQPAVRATTSVVCPPLHSETAAGQSRAKSIQGPGGLTTLSAQPSSPTPSATASLQPGPIATS